MSEIKSKFPIDVLGQFKKVKIDPKSTQLSKEQKDDLLSNIKLLRDVIIFFTATGAARGVSGHTGGPYDTVPEVCIILALFEHSIDQFYPAIFDEAGHRVATQYLLSALNGDIPFEHLLYYRQANSKLPGHPELGLTPGVKFSSGRLGHMWPFVNGVALANREKTVFCLGSDGSQQEGDDAEAARLAVAQQLNVKLLIDDNDVTIAGHPSEYMKGYEVGKTLAGHGLEIFRANGEDIDELYGAMQKAITHKGPAAVIAKRKMAPGVEGIEGSTHGHDVVSVDVACKYLTKHGYPECVEVLKSIKPSTIPYLYEGSTTEKFANRVVFGEAVCGVLAKTADKSKVMVIDSDLEGSTGLKVMSLSSCITMLISSPFIKSSPRSLFLLESWSVETFPQQQALALTRTNLESSVPSLRSWRCAYPKLPWRDSTSQTFCVISPILE